jgi:hypothetical protein
VLSSLNDASNYEQSIIKSLEEGDIFKSSLFSNSIDPFAMQFGISLSNDVTWFSTEVRRQLYKTLEQKTGEFHQILLGSVDGWVESPLVS